MDFFEKVCFFLVFAEIVSHLKPAKSYDKYIKFVTGIICVAIVITPLLDFFNEEGGSVEASLKRFQIYMEEASSQTIGEINQSGVLNQLDTMQDYELQEIKNKINTLISEKGYEVSGISISENQLEIVLKEQSKVQLQKKSIEIGEIRLNGNHEDEIKSIIEGGLGVREENIKIVFV